MNCNRRHLHFYRVNFPRHELLNLLNGVLVHLDKKNDVPLRDEAREDTVKRMCDFMILLNYNSDFDQSFQQALIDGDNHIIYPILYYLLTNWDMLRKRTYLSQFLVDMDIDDQHMDEEMRELYQEYKDMQAEFQMTHQELETAQQNAMNPEELQRDFNQLEQEKE